MRTLINPLTIVIGCGGLFSLTLVGSVKEPSQKSLAGTILNGFEDDKDAQSNSSFPISEQPIKVEGVLTSSQTAKEDFVPTMTRVRVSIDKEVRAKILQKSESFIVDVDPQAPLVLRNKDVKVELKAKRLSVNKSMVTTNSKTGKEKSPSQSVLPLPAEEERTDSVDVKQKTLENTSLLEQIRKDPRRIYIDSTVESTDLRFGVVNVSPRLGIEVYVENTGISKKNYYMPKVKSGGIEGRFEGTYLAPGSKYFGVIPLANLGSATGFEVIFSATPGTEKKMNVKLAW